MMTSRSRVRIAVLDDYQGVACELADWRTVQSRAQLDVFTDHLDGAAVVERLQPYDVVCVMRERTPLHRAMLEQLPRLKMICSTGRRNASIDVAAATARGIEVTFTGYTSAPTIEYTWALILASARHIVTENASLRAGGWQTAIGDDLDGKTLGIIGLGSIGSQVARIGAAFGMRVVAWSQNLTSAAATAGGAEWVSKEDLLRQSDVVTIHLVLSARTTGLIGSAELALMKPSARLINTSRGPIVEEAALIAALEQRRIAGAAVDVYDVEPLPAEHPYRRLDRMLATPHIGYVSRELYRRFYADTVSNVAGWLDAHAGRDPDVSE